jgi:hypothetical protein
VAHGDLLLDSKQLKQVWRWMQSSANRSPTDIPCNREINWEFLGFRLTGADATRTPHDTYLRFAEQAD